MPWKTEGSLNLLYWIYIFYYSGVLSNLRLPWKTQLPWDFLLYWIYFLHSEFLSNLRLPWKTEVCLNLLYWIYIFHHSGVLSNLRLPWKRVAQNFFAVWNILLTFRIFEQLALALKTELPWKFSLYWLYFLHSEFLSNLRLPWKTEVTLNLLYWM